MKKFGRKITDNFADQFYNEEEGSNYQNNFMTILNEGDIYQRELSKKLKLSQSQNSSDNNQDNFYILKTKSISNSKGKLNITDNMQSKDKFNISSDDKDKANFSKTKKLIRLSELEQNNLYFILKIEENSCEEIIKKSYRSLCMTCHPDKGGNTEEFNKINRAYKILSNKLCRNIYNKFSNIAIDLIEHILTLENQEEVYNKYNEYLTDDCDYELLKILIKK